MRIDDSLRPECMPEMVYCICKMTLIKDEKEEIQRAICLDYKNKESQAQFNQVFEFAVKSGFIKNQNGIVTCCLDKSRIDTFAQFRMQVANEVFKNRDSKFVKVAEWYMKKEDYYIFSQDTGESLAAYYNDEKVADEDKTNRISREFAHGFWFWMVDLGFLSFQSYRSGPALFSCHNYLRQWIQEQNFERGKYYPVRIFMNQLFKDCPLFESMQHQNHLNLAFSMAMRVLKNTNYIDVKRVKDSGDVWHLMDTNIDPWIIINDSDSKSSYKNEFSELSIIGD